MDASSQVSLKICGPECRCRHLAFIFFLFFRTGENLGMNSEEKGGVSVFFCVLCTRYQMLILWRLFALWGNCLSMFLLFVVCFFMLF